MATVIPKNAVRFTIDEIAAATNGRILRGGPPSVGMCTDSRAVDRRSAFVALIGEHFDGHAFLANAVAAGARALIVSRDIAVSQVGAPDVGPAVVRVADTRRALGDLARYHRLRWQRSASPSGKRSVIGITGSAGKTTTKTVLATILEAFFPGAVLATHGNLNNDVGVPMMLFGLAPEHWLGVFELGTNAKGEIARLSEIAVPDVAVLTLVAVAHTEGIGTIDDVAAEKGSLFAALTQEGLCVVNADDARAVAQLVRSPAKRRVSYGFSEKADVRILSRVALGIGGSQITL
ncbi:MAG TPA: UDP-N-acetylmuramoyl-tripeptide--D-alanyl-D-alanine ligase, partial [Polyangiaceae bacterium]